MPFHDMLAGSIFAPEEIKILVAAFEGACDEIGLKDRDDVMAEIVAKAVIQTGGRQMADARTLKNQALALLRTRKSS